MAWAIETEGLTKRYGSITAVDNLSLQVPDAGVFGLLGPNGSGKTTSMGMLLGLIRPTAGSIRLFGNAVEGVHPDSLRRIGAIVEEPNFYPYLSGRDNLRYFQGITGRETPGEVDHLLEMVGLSDRANSKVSTYSLGMKQRLGIAYTLLGDPDMLLLDEPTNGLDPAGMAEVRDLIRHLGGTGRAVLLSSHVLHEVEQVCDSLAILSNGKLIAQGEVAELLHSRGRERIRMRTTDNVRAIEVLSALEWVEDVISDDNSILVTAPGDRASELSAALSESEIYVTEMAVPRMSLEQYFLEVTGDDLGEAR